MSPRGKAEQNFSCETTGALSGISPHLVSLCAELSISSQYLTARGLREIEIATRLEIAERGVDGKEHLLIPAAANAWRNLKAAALEDNVSLFIVSAFRSIERQTEIVRQKIVAGATIENILAVCAPPGFSEHHGGRAVDLSTPGCRSLDVEFEQTPAFAWLCARAADFSCQLSYPIGNSSGYQYEPWHWCFNDAEPVG